MRSLLVIVLFAVSAAKAFAQFPESAGKLIAAARAQVGVTKSYDPAYVVLGYPGGDVPEDRGVCTDVVIDDGRYDPAILGRVRDTIQAGLAGWGRASLADSRRSDGVQIADVIANSLYNITVHSARARRIGIILEPMLASKAIRIAELTRLP